jgi:glycosyltransferase involved in cell wall biosynthesis
MEEAFGYSRWLSREGFVPVVVRLHGPWFLTGPAMGVHQDVAFHRRVQDEREAISLASGVTAPSEYVLERTRAFYDLALDNAEVIPNAAPISAGTERWELANCDPNLILFIGRFDRLKGGDLLVEAFAQVVQRIPQARLWIVGPDRGLDDDQRRRWSVTDYLKDRIPHAVASGQVEWMGQLPQSALPALRRRALVTVVCSRYETFPGTVLEAISIGCPVIATQVGGIPEIIHDGVNGLLCQPDNAEDLADKLCALLSDCSLAARLGRQASSDCEWRYHPSILAEKTLSYYRRVIDRSGNSPPY